MSIFQKFGASAAAAALVVTSVGAGVALPEVAEAQTIRQPRSCDLLDRERQRIARDDQRIAERGSRDIGRVITRGGSIGDALRGIAGSQVERQVSRATRDTSYIRDLEYRCAEERDLMQAGVCRNRTSERGSVDTANGRVVGSARGRIDESRDCTSQTYGSPNERTLTNPNGSNRDASYTPGRTTGTDFSRCAQVTDQGRPALACPTENGGVRIVPMPSSTPTPRR